MRELSPPRIPWKSAEQHSKSVNLELESSKSYDIIEFYECVGKGEPSLSPESFLSKVGNF